VTLPIIVVAGLLLGHAGSSDHSSSSDKPLPAVTAPAPPEHDAATLTACNKVLESINSITTLKSLTPRIVHTVPGTAPTSSFVVAWGDPAITLSCGVARPKELHHGSSAQFFLIAPPKAAGPYYAVTSRNGNEVYTTVDRPVYIQITVPAKYQGGAYVTTLSAAIDKALPAVCVGAQSNTPPLVPDSKLCANRP